MRLVLVELSRFRSRRTIALLALAAAVTAVVLAGVVAWDTRPLSGADRSDASAQADLEGRSPGLQAELRACRASPHDFLGPTATAADCDRAFLPGAQDYYPRHDLTLGGALRQDGINLALVLAGLMVIAGATFAGADWASGSLTNQLLFEPRRGRLWLAKAAAVGLGCAGLTAVVLAAFWVGLSLVMRSRGLDVPGGDVATIAWHVLRAAALGAGAGIGAFALTMVFRHTVAALALLFVYAVGGEIALTVLPWSGAGRWSVGNNTYGWLSAHGTYFDPTIRCGPGERCGGMQTITHLQAGTFLGVLLVVAALVSLLWFRRRDV